MGKRKSAAASAVEFFQTAPIDVAESVLEICVTTVKGRRPAGKPRSASGGKRRQVDVPGSTTNVAVGE